MNNNEYSADVTWKMKAKKGKEKRKLMINVQWVSVSIVQMATQRLEKLSHFSEVKQLNADTIQGLKFMFASLQSTYLMQLYNICLKC